MNIRKSEHTRGRFLGMLCVFMTIVMGVQGASPGRIKKQQVIPQRFVIGVHSGIDIGGAAPWPPGKIGGQSKMRAVPHLSPALGLSWTTIYSPRWSASIEATYKTVSLDATAWVTDQQFKDVESGLIKHFRGTTDATMGFSMIEVPLYVRYTFASRMDRLMFGGYYSYVIRGRFRANPLKGTLTSDPSSNDPNDYDPVLPGDQVEQDFSGYLSKWDAGMILGYERVVLPRLTLSARFMMGFKDIFRSDSKYLEYKMLNMRGALVFSYQFMRK